MAEPVTLDMSTAKPIAANPVTLDMSTARPIEGAQPKSWWQKTKEFEAAHGKGMPGAGEGAGLAGGLAEWDKASFGEIGGGVKDILSGNVAKGLHRIMSGGGSLTVPALPFAAAGAPVATGLGLAGGTAGGAAAHAGATALGATPDQADLAGDVGSLAGGYGAARGGTAAIDAIPSTVRTAPVRLAARSAEAAINQKLVPVRPIVNLMTPADAAEAVNVKIPGRDYGLPAPATNPGAPLPATPPPAAALARGPNPAAGLAQAAPPVPAAAAAPAPAPVPVQTAAPAAPAPAAQPTPTPTPALLAQQLQEALGGKALERGVPLRNQFQAKPAAEAPKLPEGFTPVESSALRGYKYDPAAKEFESITTGGQRYVHGDVSPEQAASFEAADSKGKAWNDLRQGSTLVAKVVNGKRIATKPSMGGRSAGELGGGQPSVASAKAPEVQSSAVSPFKDNEGGLLYHGTNSSIAQFNASTPTYLTPEAAETEAFARGDIPGTGRGSKGSAPATLSVKAKPGATKNINAQIEDDLVNGDGDPDQVIADYKKAHPDTRYVTFDHPSSIGDKSFKVVVSLYPDEDLAILQSQKLQSPAAAAKAPAVPPAPESKLETLRKVLNQPEKTPPANTDLLSLLNDSLKQVQKEGVPTTVAPKDLAKRWGVDADSLASGREQTRGMTPAETEEQIAQLAEAYKNGKKPEPVIETRDADNNIVSVDGRARAIAAERAGVKRIPIIVRRQGAAKVPTQ